MTACACAENIFTCPPPYPSTRGAKIHRNPPDPGSTIVWQRSTLFLAELCTSMVFEFEQKWLSYVVQGASTASKRRSKCVYLEEPSRRHKGVSYVAVPGGNHDSSKPLKAGTYAQQGGGVPPNGLASGENISLCPSRHCCETWLYSLRRPRVRMIQSALPPAHLHST